MVLSNVDCTVGGGTALGGATFGGWTGVGEDWITVFGCSGFLNIKTDKYQVYRDLIKNPYLDLKEVDFAEMDLMDWSKNLSDHYTIYEYATGTIVSLIYPLPINY